MLLQLFSLSFFLYSPFKVHDRLWKVVTFVIFFRGGGNLVLVLAKNGDFKISAFLSLVAKDGYLKNSAFPVL